MEKNRKGKATSKYGRNYMTSSTNKLKNYNNWNKNYI